MHRQNITAATAADVNPTHARKTHAQTLSPPPSPPHFRIECALWKRRVLLVFAVAVSSSLLLTLPAPCAAVGYSYTRFAGPVAGPEREVLVRDAFSGGPRVDYVAKPEYQFAYGVEDGKTRVLQNRKEERDGDAVTGVYSVVDPDGNLRVVKYTADNVNGFQAEVISNGIATLHGYNNLINANDNNNWYVQTGEPGQVQLVQHNAQPHQQQQHQHQQEQQQNGDPQQEVEVASEKANGSQNNSDDDDDDEDDSDSRSDYGEDDADGDGKYYGSSEESSREVNEDDDYY